LCVSVPERERSRQQQQKIKRITDISRQVSQNKTKTKDRENKKEGKVVPTTSRQPPHKRTTIKFFDDCLIL
jgi:hypothetical protein